MEFKKKFGVASQIFLLVVATISFSYFLDASFVSAQTEIPIPDETQTQNSNEINQEIANRCPNGDIECIENIYSQIESEADSGSGLSEGLRNLLNLLGFTTPSLNEVSGENFLNSLIDASGGVYTCPLTKTGEVCVELTGNVCADSCMEECVRGQTESFVNGVCSVGVCLLESGICTEGAAKWDCEENDHGTWYSFDRRPAACEIGCCKYAGGPEFVNEGYCKSIAEGNGLEFGSEITWEKGVGEFECILSATPELKGACLFPQENDPDNEKKDCRFVTADQCKGIVGNAILDANFHPNKLCSNPELNTICEKTKETKCVEDLDGVYWYDSCGNLENVYDSSKSDNGWNNGIALSQAESCSVADGGNNLANQRNCGNCNRLIGTTCGEKNGDEKLDDSSQDYVCRWMGCTFKDFNGQIVRREHGESWCGYQGRVGLPAFDVPETELVRSLLVSQLPSNPILTFLNGDRSTDTPGSTHYRMTCFDGKVTANACANTRSDICSETKSQGDGGKTFSQAVCEQNRWEECLAINPGIVQSQIVGRAGPLAGKLSDLLVRAQCSANPHCFVKTVDLTEKSTDTFKFSYCAPRYPPGFDFTDEKTTEGAAKICQQASATCTSVWVKELYGGWTCKANCKCEQDNFAFVEQMNQLCTSLGDCGMKVNYAGGFQPQSGYAVYEGKRGGIRGQIIGALPIALGTVLPHTNDAIPNAGEFIPTSMRQGDSSRNPIQEFLGGGFNLNSLFGRLRGDGQGTGDGSVVPDIGNVGVDVGPAYALAGVTGLGGATGIAFAHAFPTVLTYSFPATPEFAAAFLPYPSASYGNGFITTSGTAVVNPSIVGFSGAAVGASLGLAATAFLLDVTGIGRGLDSFTAYGLMAAGAGGGGALGYGLTSWAITSSGGNALPGAAAAGPIGVIVLVAVAVIITIFKILGVGDVEERKVTFECKPWVAPSQGDCSLCNDEGNRKDKLSDGNTNWPCNKYACEALGQNCKYITESEGENGGRCESVNERDTTAPRIISLNEEILEDEFEYVNDQNLGVGFGIEKIEGECLNQFEDVNFGFELDEYATSCALVGKWEPGDTFEEMKTSGIATGGGREPKFRVSSADFERLGIENLESETRNEITLYLACENLVEVENSIRPYLINLCVVPQDRSAPAVYTNWISFDVLPYDSTAFEVTIPVNEPAECRWSFRSSDAFLQMPLENQCLTELNPLTNRYSCNVNVPVSSENTEIFVRCKDHPEWIGTSRENERNENLESRTVKLTRSRSELQIVSASPDGTNYTMGTTEKNVELKVEVSGGVDGTANCFYKVDNFGEDAFSEPGEKSAAHKQTIAVSEGEHSVLIKCTDGVNPAVEKTVKFGVVRDTVAPTVTRVYDDSGALTVITNERAICAFVNTPLSNADGGARAICDFTVGEAGTIAISGARDTNGLIHVLESYNPSVTYHIKCKDHPEWVGEQEAERNENSGCDLIATGGI